VRWRSAGDDARTRTFTPLRAQAPQGVRVGGGSQPTSLKRSRLFRRAADRRRLWSRFRQSGCAHVAQPLTAAGACRRRGFLRRLQGRGEPSGMGERREWPGLTYALRPRQQRERVRRARHNAAAAVCRQSFPAMNVHYCGSAREICHLNGEWMRFMAGDSAPGNDANG
jgi:hypothetical protein